MKSRKSIAAQFALLAMVLWAPASFAESTPPDVKADLKASQQMMGTTGDLSKQMGTMSETMMQGKMDPEMMKKMGSQMKMMSEMMGKMSGMMGSNMMQIMASGDTQKNMDEMKKQMDEMKK